MTVKTIGEIISNIKLPRKLLDKEKLREEFLTYLQ